MARQKPIELRPAIWPFRRMTIVTDPKGHEIAPPLNLGIVRLGNG
jgi:hypothetical protein